MTHQSDQGEWSRADPKASRFEPLPDHRNRWHAGLATGEATPERWFEPLPTVRPAGHAGLNPALVAIVILASVFGAVAGGGATYLVLRQSGALALPSASPAQTFGPIAVQPEYAAIAQAAARVAPSVVTITTSEPSGQNVGSGIVYDSEGWILTNKHLVLGASRIDVRLPDGREYSGHIYGVDSLTDLSILRLQGAHSLAAAPMGDSSTLQVGQLAIAIGSPFGSGFPSSVTSGIVSALGRDVTVGSDTGSAGTSLHGLIQTDAAINPGNSGGPLVDASGRVIGVTTVLAEQAQGLGFAIPIDVAKPIMQQALAGESLSRPFMGLSYVPVNRGLADRNGLPLDHGVWVHREDDAGRSIQAVLTDGPADRAGIRTGDIITAIEGQTIDASHLFEDILVRYAPGRTVTVELYRAGGFKTVRVTLGTRPTESN